MSETVLMDLPMPEDVVIDTELTLNGRLVPVHIPANAHTSTRDIAKRIISEQGIPVYAESSVISLVDYHIKRHRQALLDARDDAPLQAAARDKVPEDPAPGAPTLDSEQMSQEGGSNGAHTHADDDGEAGQKDDALLNEWKDAFEAHHVAYKPATSLEESVQEECDEDDMRFSTMFHNLIHSPVMHDLLRMEAGFMDSVADMVEKRDRTLDRLQLENAREMERMALRASDGSVGDSEVTRLLREQADNFNILKGNLNAEIKAHKHQQKKAFRDIVHELFTNPQEQARSLAALQRKEALLRSRDAADDAASSAGRGDDDPHAIGNGSGSQSPTKQPSSKSVWSVFRNATATMATSAQARDDQAHDLASSRSSLSTSLGRGDPHPIHESLVESFTISLGTQKKIEHNIRILTGDVIDMCGVEASREEEVKAKRFATTMNIYSQNLSAVIVIVDSRLSSDSGIKAQFASICERSTDLHFAELPEQISTLQNDLSTASSTSSTGAMSTNSTSSESEAAQTDQRGNSNSSHAHQLLKPGDFYITRHSTLSEAQVVFHLVEDAQVHSADFSSQSNMLKGLRNVIRCVFQNDIQTITIPLLLVHEYDKKMDDRFCEKRCDLLLKTIKGFIMENTAWGRETAKTIQLLVPKDTSPERFDMFVEITSSIFRQTRGVGTG